MVAWEPLARLAGGGGEYLLRAQMGKLTGTTVFKKQWPRSFHSPQWTPNCPGCELHTLPVCQLTRSPKRPAHRAEGGGLGWSFQKACAEPALGAGSLCCPHPPVPVTGRGLC